MDCHRHKDGRVGMLCVGANVIREEALSLCYDTVFGYDYICLGVR